jgi:hypothetical protein
VGAVLETAHGTPAVVVPDNTRERDHRPCGGLVHECGVFRDVERGLADLGP